MKTDAYLESYGVRFERHAHPRTFTAQGLAEAERVSGYEVAKPVIVKSGQGYAVCVLPAPKRLDLKRVGWVLNDPDVRLATEAEMEKLFPDCELGAEPPIGPMFDLPTIEDESLARDEYIIMAAGTHTDAIRVLRSEWERVCKPLRAAIAMR